MLLQLWIAITGCLFIWLTASPAPRTRRIGYAVGLLGQVGWFADTVGTDRWGVFTMTIIWTVGMVRGFRNARG
jgi:hypothetical protein